MRKKRIFCFLISITVFLINCKVNAYGYNSSKNEINEQYKIESNSNGFASAGKTGTCGDADKPDELGCAAYGSYFEIRFGLFTKDENGFHHVEGTDVVEMHHEVSEKNETYAYGYLVEPNKYINESENNYTNVNFSNYNNFISFSGMNTDNAGTATQEDAQNTEWGRKYGYTTPITWGTYLGLDPDYETGFTHMTENRKKMEEYIVSGLKKNKVPEQDRYVSFVDFFLHVCGFSEDWETNESEKQKLSTKDYYIVAEPIYTLSTRYSDGWHEIYGTPGQILSWARENANTDYWIAFDDNIAFNFMCNFVDNTFEQTRLCESNQGLNFYFYHSNSVGYRANAFKNSHYAKLAMPQQGYAKSSFEISKVISKEKAKYDCDYRVTTCNDDNFIFKSTLSYENFGTANQNIDDSGIGGSAQVFRGALTNKTILYNCIYPEEGLRDNLKSYVYTPGGDTDLWCYDNVTYDFTDLKKLQDTQYTANTYAEIPNGKLKVSRTCYTKNKNLEETHADTLKNLFKDDSIPNDMQKYQNEFYFNFNNQTLKFVRDTDKGVYHDSDENYYQKEEKFERANFDYAIYAADLYYDYVIENGINSENLRTNIQLKTDVIDLNTNTVGFIKEFQNSRVIKLNDTKEYQYNIKNAISPYLNNAFGLSNILVEKIGNGASFTATENQVNKGINTEVSISANYNIIGSGNGKCEITTNLKPSPTIGTLQKIQFRIISLDNPFPGRDGTSRLPGNNWLNESENNVYTYIEKNRGVKEEEVYNKEPIYKVTLDTEAMIKIREYNKGHSYSDANMVCEEGTGRMCKSQFLRENSYLNLEGTCKEINDAEITTLNKNIKKYISNCSTSQVCIDQYPALLEKYDTNKDGKVTDADYLKADFYTCADKTYTSGG